MPPLHSSLGRNSPLPPHRLFGRENELAYIAERLADPAVRLITIVGLGGMGKTRSAVEAAGRALDQYADGVWFVPLAPVTNAEQIVATLVCNARHSRVWRDGSGSPPHVLSWQQTGTSDP